MNLKKFNSLVDLFFHQAEKENSQTPFLEWLNPKNKKKFTWGETSANIHKLAKVLKENIVDANSQWNDIKNVKVRNFNFKAETGLPSHTQIGVVAQEIETTSPKLVTENEEGIKEVGYSVLYMKAIKALQEAMTRIETLEAEVAALKAA